jgi:hypothetical protein
MEEKNGDINFPCKATISGIYKLVAILFPMLAVKMWQVGLLPYRATPQREIQQKKKKNR